MDPEKLRKMQDERAEAALAQLRSLARAARADSLRRANEITYDMANLLAKRKNERAPVGAMGKIFTKAMKIRAQIESRSR